MLIIKTDLKNKNWLVYLVDEFIRINAAQFDCKVAEIHESIPSEHILFYTKDFVCGPSIVNRSEISTDSLFVRYSDTIYILKNTKVKNEQFLCDYDIFWNAFFILSRREEYIAENNFRKIHSYSMKHPRKDKTTFAIPLVNNLFDELEKILRDTFPDLTFGEKEKPIIELSHDVDYINKTPQLRLKQTVFNLFNSFKQISNPRRCLRSVSKAVQFSLSNPSYWCFDYWEELEKRFHKRSIYYVYAKTHSKNFKSWLFDPSYTITENIKLQQQIKHLVKEGFNIGLHGSFYSAVNESLLKKEKEILENCIDREVIKIRQHWLRYEENITPYIHNMLFKYDSTLGWNDRIGFRSGCASLYRPYDHKNQKSFNFYEIPQVLMDSNIFDYAADTVELSHARAFELLDLLKKYKKTHVAISWHQRVCSSDYRWNHVYENILRII